MPVKEAKDGSEQKLKRRIKKLESENRRLKSELNSLEQAFKNTGEYIKGNVDGISVEKMIDAAKKGQKMKDTVGDEVCPECSSGLLKKIPSPAGTVTICGNCKYRGKSA